MADRAVGTGFTGNPRPVAGHRAPDGRADLGAELLDELTDFTFALRLAGIPVTIEATMDFFRAVAESNAFRRPDLYATGRATFCADGTHLDCYDIVFERFFAEPGLPQQRRRNPSGRYRPAPPRWNGADA